MALQADNSDCLSFNWLKRKALNVSVLRVPAWRAGGNDKSIKAAFAYTPRQTSTFDFHMHCSRYSHPGHVWWEAISSILHFKMCPFNIPLLPSKDLKSAEVPCLFLSKILSKVTEHPVPTSRRMDCLAPISSRWTSGCCQDALETTCRGE